MFFIMGITSGQKELTNIKSMNICPICSHYCSYKIFATYMCLTIFFIPVFKWGKRYIAQSNCCNSLFELCREKGRLIEKGEEVTITDSDLSAIKQQYFGG